MQKNLIKLFKVAYPEPSSELNFNNEYQLIVSVVLSAQCTDKKVNEVTPLLFKKFSKFKALSKATVLEVEKIIRPVNYYKTKSKNLVALAQIVESKFRGKLPQTMDELIELPGVGRKTASVVLGELGIEHTLPVDTHVFRVSQRLGLAKGKTTDAIEQQLKARFKSELWRPLHHWLILHGRKVCKAQRPLCHECSLFKICPMGLGKKENY